MRDLRLGELVLMPDDELATVVYFAHDGRVAVETPWSAQWRRYPPSELRRLESEDSYGCST
jgi:hypothetical protein